MLFHNFTYEWLHIVLHILAATFPAFFLNCPCCPEESSPAGTSTTASGINTGCCPNEIPAILTATAFCRELVPPFGGRGYLCNHPDFEECDACENLDGANCVLEWDSGSNSWKGSINGSRGIWELELLCSTSPGNCLDLKLSGDATDCGAAAPGSGVSPTEAFDCSCDCEPFEVEFTLDGQNCCDDFLGPGVDVQVTA